MWSIFGNFSNFGRASGYRDPGPANQRCPVGNLASQRFTLAARPTPEDTRIFLGSWALSTTLSLSDTERLHTVNRSWNRKGWGGFGLVLPCLTSPLPDLPPLPLPMGMREGDVRQGSASPTRSPHPCPNFCGSNRKFNQQAGGGSVWHRLVAHSINCGAKASTEHPSYVTPGFAPIPIHACSMHDRLRSSTCLHLFV